MKKRLLLFTFLFCVFSVHAQFFTELSLMTPHYYPGEIYFKDGHQESYDEAELPRVDKSNLHVKKHKGDKKRVTIEAIDIVKIKIWHRNFPDKAHELYYLYAQKALMNDDNQWGVPIAASEWGVVYQCEMNYEIDKNTGDLNVVKFVGGNTADTPTLYYLLRPNWPKAQLVSVNGLWALKKKVAKLFAENSDISKRIKNGSLELSDIQYILDEMAGGKNQGLLEIMTKDSIVQPSQNGVGGDDE